MTRKSKRRAFLAGVAASGVALAGCSQIGGTTDQDGTPTDNSTTDPGTTPGTDQPPSDGPQNQHHYTDRGEVIDNFEDLSNWGTIRGEQTAESNAVYKGSQSVRIQNPAGEAAGIYRSFPDGLDLTERDLSIAAKMEQPESGRLAVEVIAPARSDHLVCRRYFPGAMDDWMRVDLGYTGVRGNPDLSNVQELRILVLTDGEPINYLVDDLRAVPKPVNSGRVVLSFDEVRESHYDIAFNELQKRGWAAMESVNPDEVNSGGALTTGQLREMRDNGWDIISYPATGSRLPEMSADEQRRVIQDTKEYLDLKGFRDGKRFMAIPADSFNGETLDIVREFHDYGFAFGACPSTVPPVGNAAVSRVSGTDLNGAARMINIAAQYDQLAVINFPAIGEDEPASEADFLRLLNIIEDWGDDLQVTTPSELLQLEQQD